MVPELKVQQWALFLLCLAGIPSIFSEEALERVNGVQSRAAELLAEGTLIAELIEVVDVEVGGAQRRGALGPGTSDA